MSLPTPVYSSGRSKLTQMKFYGYDTLGTEGAICDMKNLTSDFWPELASRPRRKLVRTVETPGGIGAADELCWVSSTDFHYGDMVIKGFVSEGVKTFVPLGDYITIWPDKKYYDRVSGEYGSLEASITIDGAKNLYGGVSFCSWKSDLSTQGNAVAHAELGPSDFRKGDAVTISGCTRHPENNRTVIIRDWAGQVMICLDDTFALDKYLVYTVGEGGLAAGGYNIRDVDMGRSIELPAMSKGDTIEVSVTDDTVTATIGGQEQSIETVVGCFYETDIPFSIEWRDYVEADAAVTIARVMPDLQCVMEHGNRLMGCAGDTIYISALGNIFNFNVFDGTASDSWTTDTGTQGDFTAAVSYGGYPRFFKEDAIFTLYGDYPAEYALQKYEHLGVQAGSGRSLAVANGRLFYLSRSGPCIYAGGTPSLIADAFGVMRYRNGVGGSDGVKYYLSMTDENGKHHLFVYDTRSGLWMREDDLQAVGFAFHKDLYCMSGDGKVWILGRAFDPPADAADEGTVAWFAEFGDMADSSPDKKTLGRLQIRMKMEAGSAVTVSLQYDSDGVWRDMMTVSTTKKRSYVLPVIPRRLDHYRLRIAGRGECRISSIMRLTAAGSER